MTPGPYPTAVFAAEGYAVLRANPRGSSGYGTKFRQANDKDWGGGDFRDLMAGVDKVIAMGIADADRLGIMGWSYGGFMTSWTITQTDRFKAASVGARVTDLVSFTGTSDIASFLPDYFGGEFWDEGRYEVYRDHSAMAHVGNVKTPTLIQHGEADVRVPISQGYEFYNALKRQGCRRRDGDVPATAARRARAAVDPGSGGAESGLDGSVREGGGFAISRPGGASPAPTRRMSRLAAVAIRSGMRAVRLNDVRVGASPARPGPVP